MVVFYSYFGVLLVCSIHDRCAADFGHFFPMTEETPQANLLRADDIFEKKNASAESKT